MAFNCAGEMSPSTQSAKIFANGAQRPVKASFFSQTNFSWSRGHSMSNQHAKKTFGEEMVSMD